MRVIGTFEGTCQPDGSGGCACTPPG